MGPDGGSSTLKGRGVSEGLLDNQTVPTEYGVCAKCKREKHDEGASFRREARRSEWVSLSGSSPDAPSSILGQRSF